MAFKVNSTSLAAGAVANGIQTAMTIFNTSRIGIGTTTDNGYLLDVNGTGRFTSNLVTGSFVYAGNAAALQVYYETNGSASNAVWYQSAGNSYNLGYRSSGAFGSTTGLNPVITWNTSGNVGIGITSPRSVLQANGNIGMYVGSGTGTNGAQLYIGDSNFDNATYYNQAPGIGASYDATPGVAGALSFYTYNAAARRERMTITAPGNVGIGTTSPTGTYGKLSVAGGISILDDNSAKLEIGRYSSGAPNSYIKIGTNSNSLRITNAADSVDLVTFTNGGNVLIGTTTDNGAKLQVYGTATFSSTIQTGSGPTMAFVNKFAGTPSMPGNVLQLSIGGTTYYVQLYTTTL